MQYQENISLKAFNTFGIDVRARYFGRFNSTDELQQAIAGNGKTEVLLLGGGSNLLFTGNFDGLVLKNEVRGVRKIREDDDFVYVTAGAGENWHQFVLQCINNSWAGLENLSLIPGNVGASPMQNIGAYGVELREVFHELKAFHLQERCNYSFSAKDCEFGYRDSVFKKRYKNQFAILSVTFRLRKIPVFNTSYGAIEQELERMGTKNLSIKSISDAVINIRQSKLPDPLEIGNAGSFFKNPVISNEKYKELQSRFPSIIGYENNDGTIKLAAGWLIEECGWKGFRRGDAGCHERQALVLVNYGNARGEEIFQLSEDILQSVVDKFGILLEREVNVI